VLIETTDGLSAWTTVGVGQNIVEASWEALSDAYLYGLIHAGEDVAVEVGAMSLDRG
jgi:2-isopropylmalate synthase